MTTSLFISDLHLDPARPQGIQLFDDFIRQKAQAADQLFILGDLFEYWRGDDASSHCGYQSIAESLATLSSHNTKVYLMHGNRDFLMAKDFTSSFAGWLLTDPSKITLGENEVLLMHGDSLCTDDVAHQQFREQSRNPEWQKAILAKSILEREELARQLRMQSMQGNTEKPEAIMDVNQSAVETMMRKHHVQLLIHGHTHRMAIHELEVNGSKAHRIVLGDWYKKGNYLIHDEKGFRLISFPDDTVLSTLSDAAADTERLNGEAHRA